MYVWRIPLPFFAALAASTILAATWIALASLRRRVHAIIFRGVLASAVAVATILSPFLVYWITGREIERMARLGVFAHYSPYLYLAPVFVVTLLFVSSRLLFPSREGASATRWRLAFWFIAFAFTILNIANWCSPGWCERFGFPIPYSWWSDAIIVMNGRNLTAGNSGIALVTNISALFMVVAVLARSYRRSVNAEPAANDTTTCPSDSGENIP